MRGGCSAVAVSVAVEILQLLASTTMREVKVVVMSSWRILILVLAVVIVAMLVGRWRIFGPIIKASILGVEKQKQNQKSMTIFTLALAMPTIL